MNHRREGESRQKRKIDDGPITAENDPLRFPRRRLENPLERVSKTDNGCLGFRAKNKGLWQGCSAYRYHRS